ncbi:hypothetical protein BH09ACT1_BH09ACT1_12810 [soil metagenome]
MIIDSRSSLSVYSELRTAAQITAVLGLEPNDSAEKGEPTRAALAGQKLKPQYMTNERAHWSFDADENAADPNDETGFASLRVLIGAIRDSASALASLRPDCETIIWWSGYSDSVQGGFVMPADLIADLALLGCDLYGTAYIGEDDDDDDEEA